MFKSKCRGRPRSQYAARAQSVDDWALTTPRNLLSEHLLFTYIDNAFSEFPDVLGTVCFLVLDNFLLFVYSVCSE